MLRMLKVWLLIFVLAGCGGGMKGALSDLAEPEVLPPPKLTSAKVVKDRATGDLVFQMSVPDMKAEAAYREKLAGEVLKGQEGMRVYRDLLEKCLRR